jgi:hypothetical protein
MKACRACQRELPLTAFDGRRNSCRECLSAAKAKVQERKDTAQFTPQLAERCIDAIASGWTTAQIAEQSWGPTPRQLQAWRRTNPDFHQAMRQAEQISAAAHVDKGKEALRLGEAGEIPVSDAKGLAESHLKFAMALDAKRYGSNAVAIDVTSQGKPLVDFSAAIEALIAVLPVKALPAPGDVIDIEATPPTEVLQ